jgi:hypothetical protein
MRSRNDAAADGRDQGCDPGDPGNYEDHLNDRPDDYGQRPPPYDGQGWNGPPLLKPATMPIHPAALVLPMMDKDAAETLAASVNRYGLRKEIKLYADGTILDGRNRYYACLATGVEPRFEEWGEYDETTPEAFVAIHNIHRRHLTLGQRAMLATDMVTTDHGGNRRWNTTDGSIKPPIGGLKSVDGLIFRNDKTISRAEAAQQWGISLRTVERAAAIRENTADTPAVVAQVRTGRMTLGRAAMLAEMEAAKRREEPDVKFAGVIRKPKPPKPVTAATAQAWLKMDEEAKLHFRNTMVEPWYEDYMRNQR